MRACVCVCVCVCVRATCVREKERMGSDLIVALVPIIFGAVEELVKTKEKDVERPTTTTTATTTNMRSYRNS